jgi:hypothetical protein
MYDPPATMGQSVPVLLILLLYVISTRKLVVVVVVVMLGMHLTLYPDMDNLLYASLID